MNNEKRVLLSRKQKQKAKRDTGNGKSLYIEDEVPFSDVDAEDPIRARLPALVLEMRRAHEEVVSPKGWILWNILAFIPIIGAALLFRAGYGNKGTLSRNIQNYAMVASWVSLAFSFLLCAAGLLFLNHGREIWHLLLNLKGV